MEYSNCFGFGAAASSATAPVAPRIGRVTAQQKGALRLLLTLRLAGNPKLQIRRASRIAIDASGQLLIYGAAGELSATVHIEGIQSFRLTQLRRS